MTWKETMLDTWNAYFTLSGSGEVSYGDERVRTGPGELMILRPKINRDYRIPQPRQGWEFYWLHFNPTARMRLSLPWFNQPDRWQTHKMADASLRVRVASALEEMHQINLCNPQMPGREELLYAMFEAILLRHETTQGKWGAVVLLISGFCLLTTCATTSPPSPDHNHHAG